MPAVGDDVEYGVEVEVHHDYHILVEVGGLAPFPCYHEEREREEEEGKTPLRCRTQRAPSAVGEGVEVASNLVEQAQVVGVDLEGPVLGKVLVV